MGRHELKSGVWAHAHIEAYLRHMLFYLYGGVSRKFGWRSADPRGTVRCCGHGLSRLGGGEHRPTCLLVDPLSRRPGEYQAQGRPWAEHCTSGGPSESGNRWSGLELVPHLKGPAGSRPVHRGEGLRAEEGTGCAVRPRPLGEHRAPPGLENAL